MNKYLGLSFALVLSRMVNFNRYRYAISMNSTARIQLTTELRHRRLLRCSKRFDQLGLIERVWQTSAVHAEYEQTTLQIRNRLEL